MAEWEYNLWKKQNYEQYITDMIEYMRTCNRKNCIFLKDDGNGCERNYIGLDYAIDARDITAWEEYKRCRESNEPLDYSKWEKFCDSFYEDSGPCCCGCDDEECNCEGESDSPPTDFSFEIDTKGKSLEDIIKEALRDAIGGGEKDD